MLASISHYWRGQGDWQNEKSFSKLNIFSNILLSVFFHTQELLTTDSFMAILMTSVKSLNEGRKNSPIGKAGKYKNNREPERFHPVETVLYEATELFQTVIYCFETEKHTTTARPGMLPQEQVRCHSLQTLAYGWTSLLGPALLKKYFHLLY